MVSDAPTGVNDQPNPGCCSPTLDWFWSSAAPKLLPSFIWNSVYGTAGGWWTRDRVFSSKTWEIAAFLETL